MMDSSSVSARDRSSVVIVDGLALSPRTRSSISSMSARNTRFALRSPALSTVEMTLPPLEVVYLSPQHGVPFAASGIYLRIPLRRATQTLAVAVTRGAG